MGALKNRQNCEDRPLPKGFGLFVGLSAMNLLLIDDHAMFREGLALLLAPLDPALCIWEAGSCEEAQALLGAGTASDTADGAAPSPTMDLVLMDLGLPGMSGLDGIAWLHQAHPGVPVVALSSADDRDTVLKALDAGAMGFIPKSTSSAVLVGALRLVLAQGIYLPPSVFLPAAPAPAPAAHRAPAPPTVVPQAPTSHDALVQRLGLTPRQVQVLDLLLQGKPAKLIGRDLDLSLATVKTHTSAVLRALNVTTRTQAVVAASQLGWRVQG